MTERQPSHTKIGFGTGLWWLVFVVASYALSLFFQTFKMFTLQPTAQHLLEWLAAIAFALASFAVLLYDTYAKEKAKGNLYNQFPPFEWVYARQYSQISLYSEKGADPCARK
jgi:glucan phosphoethanolaminetransferase (alkaline phosphatase superfamily)